MFFFVAKVDVSKVEYDEGRAVLSPLRFDYESEDFSLPIRLGLINSKGNQDLIIHLLGLNKRYELANYPNVAIDSNLLVSDRVKADFGLFYEKLFSRTLADNPGAVVTEYAWGGNLSGKCDPCPPGYDPVSGALSGDDLATLGADVLDPQGTSVWGDLVITRLHARYGKTEASADLVFKVADALQGGVGGSGTAQMETTTGGGSSQFQGRYIVHRRWPDEVTCEDAVRGRWIGTGEVDSAPSPNTTASEPVVLEDLSLEAFLDTESIPPTGSPTVKTETVDLGPCTDPAPDWWDGEVPSTSPGQGGTLVGGGKDDPGGLCAVQRRWDGRMPLGVLLLTFALGLAVVRRRALR